jgi:integrase
VADLVSKPKVDKPDIQTLTPEEAQRLLEAASGERLEALIILMLTSACRLGELLGLRWSSLDLERGEMRITAAMKEISGHMSLGIPKTPHSRRTIPLTSLAVKALRRHKVAQTAERFKHEAGWNPDGLVFCTTAGTPISRNHFRMRDYTRILKKAGLPYAHPHTLRHTAATLLYLTNTAPHAVSKMLGHASVGFTENTYGQVQAQMLEGARDNLERLFATNPGKSEAI